MNEDKSKRANEIKGVNQMPKINREEYEVLKRRLDEDYSYIGKTRSGRLQLLVDDSIERDMNHEEWSDGWGKSYMTADKMFQFIKWEDEEPYSIVELIEEYEKDYKGSWEHAIEFSREVFGESDEEEVKKDIEWLKREVYGMFPDHNETFKHPDDITVLKTELLNEVVKKIDQLDEPEVLSQESLKNITPRIIDEWNGKPIQIIPIDKFQNLLVPKQEEITEEQAWEVIHGKYGDEVLQNNIDYVESQGYVVIEKPTIPQFIAEYIQEGHELGVDLGTALTIETAHLNDIKKYIRDNEETFSRAWLAYPNIEVEEEPLYRARLKVITDEFIASYLRTQSSDAEDRLKALEIGSKYTHEDYRHLSEFTEDELKRLGIWDSEQWEIEELEE